MMSDCTMMFVITNESTVSVILTSLKNKFKGNLEFHVVNMVAFEKAS